MYFCATVKWDAAPGAADPEHSGHSAATPAGGIGGADRTANAPPVRGASSISKNTHVVQKNATRSGRISRAALAAAPPGEQTRMLQSKLQEAVAAHCPELASVVTNTLLERENMELLGMLECDDALRVGILQALRAAGGWKKKATHEGSATSVTPNTATPPRTTAC